MNQNLQTLVAQAKTGDAHAFALLYEDIYKDLYRFAYCTMKQKHQAEDVVSAAVLHAFEHIHKLRKDSSFRSWMFQITANECKRQLRLQTKTIDIPDDEMPQGFYSVDLAERFTLKQAFSTLEETERLIVALHLFGGYTSREIARHLHKKEGTVRSAKSRALEKMKTFLDGTKTQNGGKNNE